MRAVLVAGCTLTAPAVAAGVSGVNHGLPGISSALEGVQLEASLAADRQAQLPARQIAASINIPNALVTHALMNFDAGALVAGDVVAGTLGAGTGVQIPRPIAGVVPSEQVAIAPGAAFGPINAFSTVPGVQISVVASRGNGGKAGAVHALIHQPGEIVSWVKLPLTGLPEAVFVLAASRMICVSPVPGGGTEFIALDYRGQILAHRRLKDLLPPGALRSEQPVTLMATVTGTCLSVPLQCGSLALVEPAVASGPPDQVHNFRSCSIVLSDKFACGVDGWLEEARKLDRAGEADAARYALEAAIETDPTDARGYRELAHFYRRRGETSEQLDCLQVGVARLHAAATGAADDDWQVGTPAARLTLDYVNAARAVKDPQLAENALNQALELYPCMEQVVLMRAELMIERGEVDQAVTSLRTALAQIDPNSDLAAAHHDVGRFLKRHGQTAAALNFCADAFALGDHSEFLLRGLADVSVELGRPERAVDWLSLLAERWRSAKNGDSTDSRTQRAQDRLRELDEEIARLQASVK